MAFESIDPQKENINTPEILNIGSEEMEIYDVGPDNPKGMPVVFQPGWGRDPYKLYDKVNKKFGFRMDPCLLDVFISAVRFMEGEPARPWYFYTKERKAKIEK